MTIARGHVCGRGASVSSSVLSLTCDLDAGCTASVTAFGAEQIEAVAAIGWRTEGLRALCPEHSGAQLQLDPGIST